MELEGLDREALLDLVGRHPWDQTIDLGGGVLTPGRGGPPSRYLVEAIEAIDFRGKAVLDVGCGDGLWSFEAEKRGAAVVVAIDGVATPSFRLAHAALVSRVRYHPEVSPYAVARLGRRDFDVVLFLGGYHRLKHPLLALERLGSVLRDGGRLVVEGEVVPTAENLVRFHHHEIHKDDASNWWVPSIRCLREWIECSGFRIEREWSPVSWGGPADRHAVTAVAVGGGEARGDDLDYGVPGPAEKPAPTR